MEPYDNESEMGSKYGTANGDGKVDGGYTTTKSGNRLQINAGENKGQNDRFDFSISVSGRPPTASISGTITVGPDGIVSSGSFGSHMVGWRVEGIHVALP